MATAIRAAVAAVALALAAPARAAPLDLPRLEWVYDAASTADMLTTLDICKRPGMYETNHVLGRHPSDARIVGYFLATDVLHAAATTLLERVAPRLVPIWEASGIALEAGYAAHNLHIGLSFRFA